jgi:hypothetical protein
LVLGQAVLLDTATERFYALLEAHEFSRSSPSPWRANMLAWSPTGEMLVKVSSLSGGVNVSALFAGRPHGPFRRLDIEPANAAAYSPNGGLLALAYGDAVRILDVATLATVDSIVVRQADGLTWSFDGRYFAFYGSITDDAFSTIVWRPEDRARFVLPGLGVLATASARIAYTTPPDHSSGLTTWIEDLDSGATQEFVRGQMAVAWSPDDKYLVTREVQGQISDFTIWRLSDGKRMARATGARFGGWLDRESLYFTGNLCSSFDLMFMRADGSDLRAFPGRPGPVVTAHLAPTKGHLAYRGLTIYDTSSGLSRTVPIGPDLSLDALDSRAPIWSLDARFIKLEGIVPRDGPCYPIPTPQITNVERD